MQRQLRKRKKVNALPTDQQTNRPTDRPTDRRTDTVEYRVAFTRLKIGSNRFQCTKQTYGLIETTATIDQRSGRHNVFCRQLTSWTELAPIGCVGSDSTNTINGPLRHEIVSIHHSIAFPRFPYPPNLCSHFIAFLTLRALWIVIA